MRDISAQRQPQLFAVIGKELRIVSSTRDGNVRLTVVEQVFGPEVGVGMDQYAISSLALAEWLVTA